jgi:hypothetical protein
MERWFVPEDPNNACHLMSLVANCINLMAGQRAPSWSAVTLAQITRVVGNVRRGGGGKGAAPFMRLLHTRERKKREVDAWKSPSEAISLLRKYSAAYQEPGNNGREPA